MVSPGLDLELSFSQAVQGLGLSAQAARLLWLPDAAWASKFAVAHGVVVEGAPSGGAWAEVLRFHTGSFRVAGEPPMPPLPPASAGAVERWMSLGANRGVDAARGDAGEAERWLMLQLAPDEA